MWKIFFFDVVKMRKIKLVGMKITLHPHTMRFLFELKRWQAFEWRMGYVASRTQRGCITRATANAENVQMQCVCVCHGFKFIPPSTRRINKRLSRFAGMRQQRHSMCCKHLKGFASVAHSYSCFHIIRIVCMTRSLPISSLTLPEWIIGSMCVLFRSNSKLFE